MKNALEVSHLTKDYGSFKLDDVSFTVPGGTIMGLIGENGAGKSTTIKCILNLVRRDGGEIQVLGLDNLADERAVKAQVGVVLDETTFHDGLSAPQVGSILARLYPGWDGALYQHYLEKFGLTSKTGIDLPGEERSVVGCQTSLYDPDKAMDEASQDTAVPIIVFNSLKKHLRNCGASRNITYDDERLNRCVKRLMDMAVNTDQGNGGELWLQQIRPILMEELNMTREMVFTQSIIGDTFNYLNDIKWGPSQTVQVAIGQSITVLTPAAVSRYVAALGNGGKVYNLMLVDSITSPEGDIVSQRTPSLMNEFEGAEEYLPYILKGMEGVVDESGTAAKYFRKWKYRQQVCAKTGTAEVTTIDLENNAWFVMLAPYASEMVDGVPVITQEPEIAVVVFIPSGYSGGEASMAAREFVGWYMDQKTLRTESEVFPSGNELAP